MRGNRINVDFKGGMMGKDVTKFHKCHLGGWSMVECVSVCSDILCNVTKSLKEAVANPIWVQSTIATIHTLMCV